MTDPFPPVCDRCELRPAEDYRDGADLCRSCVDAKNGDIAFELLRYAERMLEAVEFAHSEGFEWPSDPFEGLESLAEIARRLAESRAAA